MYRLEQLLFSGLEEIYEEDLEISVHCTDSTIEDHYIRIEDIEVTPDTRGEWVDDMVENHLAPLRFAKRQLEAINEIIEFEIGERYRNKDVDKIIGEYLDDKDVRMLEEYSLRSDSVPGDYLLDALQSNFDRSLEALKSTGVEECIEIYYFSRLSHRERPLPEIESGVDKVKKTYRESLENINVEDVKLSLSRKTMGFGGENY